MYCFQMDGDTCFSITEGFLTSCLDTVSSIPQMRMTVSMSLNRINRARGDLQRKLGDECSFCFSKTDLTRAEICLSKRSRRKERTLTVKCHVCKRKVREDSDVQFETSVADQADDVLSLEPEENLNKTSKKKKSKRDKTAGLSIPPSIAKPNPGRSHPKPALANKNKLKNLLANQSESPESNLMKFLSKI